MFGKYKKGNVYYMRCFKEGGGKALAHPGRCHADDMNGDEDITLEWVGPDISVLRSTATPRHMCYGRL